MARLHRPLVLLALAAACDPSGAEGELPSAASVDAVVGPQGGVLVFPGGELEVPAGALSRTATLSATRLVAGGPIRFGPAGLRFERSARLRLEPPAEVPEPLIVKLHDNVAVEGADAAETFLEPFPTARIGGWLEAKIRGFSAYATTGGSGGPGVAVLQPRLSGNLRASWDACDRTVELEWTGERRIIVERILSRDRPHERIVDRFLLAGAGEEPVRYRDRGFPRPGPGELAYTITYEAYVPYRGYGAWVRLHAEARVAALELVPPEAPRDLEVVREPSGARVSWRGPSSPEAEPTGYEAWRLPHFPDGRREIVGTSFVDREAGAQSSYTYFVRAFEDVERCGRRLVGPVVSELVPAGSAGAGLEVDGLAAQVRDQLVTLSWDPEPRAVAWRVRRSDGSAFALVAEVQSEGFSEVLDPGAYTYEVTPIGSDRGLGVPRPWISRSETVAR